MPLYFAYGSNMDADAMGLRCPGARPIGLARLARHRFGLMAEGWATVTRDPRASVWGVLWSLSLSDVRPLDAYEDIGSGLYSKAIQPVIKTAGGSAQAMIYIGRVTRGPVARQASAGYLEAIVAAGLSWGLPEPYLRQIAELGGFPLSAARSAVAILPELAVPKVRPRFATPFDR
jgi:hypothetical protein